MAILLILIQCREKYASEKSIYVLMQTDIADRETFKLLHFSNACQRYQVRVFCIYRAF